VFHIKVKGKKKNDFSTLISKSISRHCLIHPGWNHCRATNKPQ